MSTGSRDDGRAGRDDGRGGDRDEAPVLPDRSDDERDIGWGGPAGDAHDDEDEATRRLLDERPPHHLDSGD